MSYVDELNTAFKILLDGIENFIKSRTQEIAELLKKGDYDGVKVLTEEAQKLVQFKEKIRNLQAEWKNLFGKKKSDKRSGNTGRLKRGLRTREEEYELPILQSLAELGGRATVKEVLKMVYEKMKDKLNEFDLQPLKSGYDLRWRNSAQWCRFALTKRGLLSSDSPRGVWQITEKGRDYLRQVVDMGG